MIVFKLKIIFLESSAANSYKSKQRLFAVLGFLNANALILNVTAIYLI